MKTSVKMITLLLSCIAMQGAVDAAPASPTCSDWDVSGKPWVANDGGYQIIFRIDQRRPRFGGTAQYTQGVEGYTRDVQSFSRAPGANIRGSDKARISGVVKGDKIEISTEYGVIYFGTIDVNGLALGQYHFKGAASVRATWGSSRPLNCLIGTGTQPTTTSGTATSAHPQTPPNTPSPGERNASERGGGAGASVLRNTLPAVPPVAVQPPAPVVSSPRVGKTCKSSFVHRLSSPADRVCVTAKSRARVVEENRTAGTRRQPGGGAYGPNTCRAGFVWREANAGDLVCVTPAIRGLVAEENNLAASRARER